MPPTLQPIGPAVLGKQEEEKRKQENEEEYEAIHVEDWERKQEGRKEEGLKEDKDKKATKKATRAFDKQSVCSKVYN